MYYRTLMVMRLALLTGCCGDAQVVQISGVGSNTDDAQGGSLVVYGAGAASRISLGSFSADGSSKVRVGVARDITSGPVRLVLGDTTASTELLTDGSETQRLLYGRGGLLQVQAAGAASTLFVGMGGQSRGNSSVSTLVPKGMVVGANLQARLSAIHWQTLLAHGQGSLLLNSVSITPTTKTLVAMTQGWTDGKLVVRAALRHEGRSWRVDMTDTSGHLQMLQPTQLGTSPAEQIGINASVSKHFGERVSADGSRFEYAAPVVTGVPNNRSVLWEGGLTVHAKSLQTGLRLLTSGDTMARNNGVAWLEGWHRQRWSVQTTVLYQASTTNGSKTSLQCDTEQKVWRHMQLREGIRLGAGSPTFDMGGVFETNWGAVQVSHSETYLPFGPQTGFHRVLAVSLRLHVRDSEAVLTRVGASGLSPVYAGTLNDYEGGGLGSDTQAFHRTLSLPKYKLEGIVRTGTVPLAGAAVAAGNQTVYTDSTGRWMARFRTTEAVRVSLQPSEFLTAQSYRAASEARTATPQARPEPIEMRVEQSRATTAPTGTDATQAAAEPADDRSISMRIRGTRRFLWKAVRVWSR